jgi:hypothetical protein
MPEASPADSPPERPVPDFVIRPPTPGGGLPALARQREFPRWGKVAIGIAILVLVFGGAAFVFKNELAQTLPPAVRQSLGLEVEQPAAAARAPAQKPKRKAGAAPSLSSAPAAATPPEPGEIELEVDLAASKIEFVDGHYVIHGDIVNNGKAEASIHALKLLFKKDKTVLGERFYPLFDGPIKPGGRLSFSQVLDDPPADTTDIVPTVE